MQLARVCQVSQVGSQIDQPVTKQAPFDHPDRELPDSKIQTTRHDTGVRQGVRVTGLKEIFEERHRPHSV